MRAALCVALLALAASTGCDPDLPGRACSTDDDCFRDEICQGSCVTGRRAAPAGDDAAPAGDDAALDGAAGSDAGADAESS